MEAMKTIIVTGASDGIGAAGASQLAQQGHQVLMVGRSPAKLEAQAARAGVTQWFTADYANLDDVRRLAGELRRAAPRIDVLANNAGGVAPGPLLTADGFERTFQVNYLAGFLLTHELMDLLVASQGAVINTASVAAQFGALDWRDLDSRGHFVSMRAYGRAKLADILHIRGLHARYQARGLSAMAFHPGNIASNFAADMGGAMAALYTTPLKRLLTPVDQGGATLAHFAAGTVGQTWLSGRYYHSNRRLGRTHRQAYDLEFVDQLWERTNRLLGLTDR
jgi:NAD(P)-dependent dehydrogenase (short-subunit alcohol dehydrogenase family)